MEAIPWYICLIFFAFGRLSFILVWLTQRVSPHYGTIGFIYLPTRVERLSWGLIGHTCTHCGPILSLSLQIAVFFYCAISLALGVMFFYRAISLALIQVGITCNTEVTKNGPLANRLLLIRFHRCNCNLNASKSLPATNLFVSANRLWLSQHIESLTSLNRLVPRKCLQSSYYYALAREHGLG